jgi:hypothetical protein
MRKSWVRCEVRGNESALTSVWMVGVHCKGDELNRIPSLRCGMTNKRAGNSNDESDDKGKAMTTTTADSSASLRNDKQND